MGKAFKDFCLTRIKRSAMTFPVVSKDIRKSEAGKAFLFRTTGLFLFTAHAGRRTTSHAEDSETVIGFVGNLGQGNG
jgi:hypothetical protein